jgi:hypothetical protein
VVAGGAEGFDLKATGLLDILLKYVCVGLRSESPELPTLSTLSRRKPMSNRG